MPRQFALYNLLLQYIFPHCFVQNFTYDGILYYHWYCSQHYSYKVHTITRLFISRRSLNTQHRIEYLYIKGNKISGCPKSISNYERPERDEFTELPGSDKEEGGVAWRAYAAVNGGEIDGAPASVFPEEFQGTLCNNKKSAERKIFS